MKRKSIVLTTKDLKIELPKTTKADKLTLEEVKGIIEKNAPKKRAKKKTVKKKAVKKK